MTRVVIRVRVSVAVNVLQGSPYTLLVVIDFELENVGPDSTKYFTMLQLHI